jgi:Leucine-rich repeat (LRR) protein
MKKLFVLSLTLLLHIQNSFAQNYPKYMQQGKEFYNKSEYLTALERFDFASEFAKTDTEKNDAKTWKNRSREKIKEQQSELKKALAQLKAEKDTSIRLMRIAIQQKLIADKEKEISENQRKRAEAALTLAEKMQEKMETAVFDRAAKSMIPSWKNATIELFEGNFQKMKSLDLSNAGLTRIPSEVFQCENLESINLMGNDLDNLTDIFEKLAGLKKLKEIKISMNEIDSLPKKYWLMVTGLKIYRNFLKDLPADLFSFNSLTYLDLSGYWQEPMQYEARDITMSEYEKQQRNPPSELGNLSLLETLILSGNGISKLPDEISKLKNLKHLLLQNNTLSNSEKEKIKKLLPNCTIEL